jgi:hypothetical protein
MIPSQGGRQLSVQDAFMVHCQASLPGLTSRVNFYGLLPGVLSCDPRGMAGLGCWLPWLV